MRWRKALIQKVQVWQLRLRNTEQKVVGQISLHRNFSRHRRPCRHFELGQILQAADFDRFHWLRLALVDGPVEVDHLLEQVLPEATFLAPFVLGVRRGENCERERGFLGGWLLLRLSFRRFLTQKRGAAGLLLLEEWLLRGNIRRLLLLSGESGTRGGIVREIL